MFIVTEYAALTINWFDDYSASWVHRGNDHTPPPP